MQIYEKLHNVLNKRLLLPVTLYNQLRHVSPGILWLISKMHGRTKNTVTPETQTWKRKKQGNTWRCKVSQGSNHVFSLLFLFSYLEGCTWKPHHITRSTLALMKAPVGHRRRDANGTRRTFRLLTQIGKPSPPSYPAAPPPPVCSPGHLFASFILMSSA